MKYLTVGYDYDTYYGNGNHSEQISLSYDKLAEVTNKTIKEIEKLMPDLINYICESYIWLGEIDGKHSEVTCSVYTEINDSFKMDISDEDRIQEFFIEKLHDFFSDEGLQGFDFYDYFEDKKKKVDDLTLSLTHKLIFKTATDKKDFEKAYKDLCKKAIVIFKF